MERRRYRVRLQFTKIVYKYTRTKEMCQEVKTGRVCSYGKTTQQRRRRRFEKHQHRQGQGMPLQDRRSAPVPTRGGADTVIPRQTIMLRVQYPNCIPEERRLEILALRLNDQRGHCYPPTGITGIVDRLHPQEVCTGRKWRDFDLR